MGNGFLEMLGMTRERIPPLPAVGRNDKKGSELFVVVKMARADDRGLWIDDFIAGGRGLLFFFFFHKKHTPLL